jgi:outer membrane protein OmpA-like peptidoglycan-associated protein
VTLVRPILAAAAIATPLLALPAMAQPITGLYIGAAAGANSLASNRFTNTAFGAGSRDLAYEWGPAGIISMGWGFGNGIRAELEGDFRQNDVAGFAHPSAGATPGLHPGGRVRQYGFMANALYDFDLTALGISPRVVMPYIGGGVGYSISDFSRVRGAFVGGGGSQINNSAGNVAVQGIVGVAFPLDAYVPGLAATLDYRYFWSPGADRNSTTSVAPGAPTRLINERPGSANQTVMLGLRYAFNRPQPMPVAAAAPPAPAQQLARTYLVFFDWNRSDLTDRARQIIAEAATTRNSVRSTRIEVSGHADRSGSPQYNQALSQRRADTVAAELVRRGVPQNEIGIQAFGESRPLVPTADGVREPQNRRVEIVIR